MLELLYICKEIQDYNRKVVLYAADTTEVGIFVYLFIYLILGGGLMVAALVQFSVTIDPYKCGVLLHVMAIIHFLCQGGVMVVTNT